MVKVVVKDVTSSDAQRHQQWAQRARDRFREVRAKRLARLEAREGQIRAGAELLIAAHDGGTRVEQVTLRSGLVRRPGDLLVQREVDPALSPQRAAKFPGALQRARRNAKAERPPLARLVNRAGWAVPLEVAAPGSGVVSGGAGAARGSCRRAQCGQGVVVGADG